MKIILIHNTKIKQNDIGDIFELRWEEGSPAEFTFDADTTCSFAAKHKELTTEKFKRAASVNFQQKTARYVLQAGDAEIPGVYEFEFEFSNTTYDFRQTYPKAETVTYEVVKDAG